MSFKDCRKMNNDSINSVNCLNDTEGTLCVCVFAGRSQKMKDC